MKRTVALILIFSAIAMTFLTGCVVTCGDTQCRGIGYCWNVTLCHCADCLMVDDSNQKELERYNKAIEGKHYSAPRLTMEYLSGDRITVEFKMDVHQTMSLHCTVCIVQDGILLTSFENASVAVRLSKGEFAFSETYQLSQIGWNPYGGEVYCYINALEANVKLS